MRSVGSSPPPLRAYFLLSSLLTWQRACVVSQLLVTAMHNLHFISLCSSALSSIWTPTLDAMAYHDHSPSLLRTSRANLTSCRSSIAH